METLFGLDLASVRAAFKAFFSKQFNALGPSVSLVHGHNYNLYRGRSNALCTRKYADGRQKRCKK